MPITITPCVWLDNLEVNLLHKSLSDNKSPLVSRPLLSIIADLDNAVVCIIESLLLISLFSSLLGIVLHAWSTIGITVTLMLQFLQLSSKIQVFYEYYNYHYYYCCCCCYCHYYYYYPNLGKLNAIAFLLPKKYHGNQFCICFICRF